MSSGYVLHPHSEPDL
jgi:hypothetical protein